MTPSADDRRIEVVVQRTGESLHGHARDPGGQTLEFTGWLGLVSALESLLADPAAVTTMTRTERP